ncbi:MAG: LuxR family transcriptional regulator [Legionella sp.]|nr:MAG: LuxR family transcriptional regulator [Legionella sp.]
MPVLLPHDHFTFNAKTKIQDITSSFLHTHQFNYFQYLRCYIDGSVGLLTNETGLLELFQHIDNQPVIFSSYTEEHQKVSSFWFLWDEELPDMPVQMAREKFNLRNGITYVRRTQFYYDMIAVTTAFDPMNGGSFYLNKIKAIEQFINDFDVEHQDLLALMDKNPILLPEPYRDCNYDRLCLTQGKIDVQGKTGLTHITAQELACLRGLLQGLSYKNTAKRLHLSPRTVETYIQRIKARTGFANLTELERLLY